ncbi:MAG: hypothetical protein ACI8PZ_003995 [Myxococcota bacterium]|jgi:hypothetical protein
MKRFAWILAAVALTACSTKDDGGGSDTSTTGTAGGGGGGGGCANSIIDEFPANGSADAYYRTSVDFTLATAEADATIVVKDSDGADVAGTNSVEDNRVVFKPTATLTPGASYATTLDWSCGPTESTWTVDGSVGDPVTADGVAGSTYTLDLASGRFVKPAGVGDLLGSLLEFSLFVGITAADDTSLSMIGALSDDSGVAQDLCTETIDFPVAADFTENPYFVIESDRLPIEVEGFEIVIEGLTLSGAFSSGAASIEGVVLAGKIDTRPLVELVSPGGGDDAVCTLVSTFQVDCEACSDGSGDFCLSVYVEDMSAPSAGGLVVEPRTAEQIADDPTCP